MRAMPESAMPVLPDDGSRMRCPGLSDPSFSAASIIARAMRSFTEPNGFWLSILARFRTRGFGLSALTSTSGVLPIMSSAEPYTAAINEMLLGQSGFTDPFDREGHGGGMRREPAEEHSGRARLDSVDLGVHR